MVIEKLTERRGWKIVLARNGYAALDAYQKQTFDVIIMDCDMPLLDGYQTTKTIRNMEKNNDIYTPIIAMSANLLHGAREACIQAGMDDYLPKPFEVNVFYNVIGHWAKCKFNNTNAT